MTHTKVTVEQEIRETWERVKGSWPRTRDGVPHPWMKVVRERTYRPPLTYDAAMAKEVSAPIDPTFEFVRETGWKEGTQWVRITCLGYVVDEAPLVE